jgi:N-acyl-D-aspartate/D-glutamate deacylase
MLNTQVISALCCLWLIAPAQAQTTYDLVLRGGRVVDPETGLDAIRNVGIRGDSIAAISSAALVGSRVIDATGLIVAPGFIDLHQHAHEPESYNLKALDGVTMSLELEAGVPDIKAFVQVREGRTPIHFGASASHEAARVLAWDQELAPSPFGPAAAIPAPLGLPATASATREQVQRMLAYLGGEMDAGALGVGIGLEYTPGSTREEIVEVFRLAARAGQPVFVHVRSGGSLEPGSGIESVLEIIAAAAVTGASAHILHVNSTCMRDSNTCIGLIEGARARGLDVTVEAYPYGAGMTTINSAFFNPGWRERRGIDYGDLELPENGERLTASTFDQLRAQPGARFVLIHLNPDSLVDAIIRHPLVLVASDGVKSHPRNAGTYSRILARYVRTQQSLSLAEALRKMSLLPAQRLELATPAARRKGRLQVGADADVVVLDLGRVRDRATYRAPGEASQGVRYLIVAGQIVVEEGRFTKSMPGRPFLRRGS